MSTGYAQNLPDNWAAQPAFGQPGKVEAAIRSSPSNSEGGDSPALHPRLSLWLNQGLGWPYPFDYADIWFRRVTRIHFLLTSTNESLISY